MSLLEYALTVADPAMVREFYRIHKTRTGLSSAKQTYTTMVEFHINGLSMTNDPLAMELRQSRLDLWSLLYLCAYEGEASGHDTNTQQDSIR